MFIKSHNVKVNTKINKDNNSFIKECRWDINFIYERYSKFYSDISSIENLYTPKIIKVYDENHIEFEYVDLWESLKEILESWKYENELFHNIGKQLWKLHMKLNDWKIPNNWIICGDFCTWNIFLKEENLYFIDFEPPFRILVSDRDNADFLTNSNYIEDIWQFIFRLENILIPKKPLLFLKSFKQERNIFLEWYQEATEIKISKSKLEKKLKDIAKMEISSEKNFRNTITFLITKFIYKFKYHV